MQKILRKRVWRDLKEHFWRYLALGLLIILAMYIVISLVAAADTIMTGTKELAEENKCEDGQFRVFVPLSDAEERQLTAHGITLEKMFYFDFLLNDGSSLRVYQNRKNINLIALDEGKMAEKEGELVVEKRYAKEHQLGIGDGVKVGEKNFTIVGIGSVPDYEAPFKEFSDSAVDSSHFGVAFVTEEMYGDLRKSEQSEKAESYYYAFLLNEKMTTEELKEELKEITVSPEEVEDEFFQSYWDRTGGKVEKWKEVMKQMPGSEEFMEESFDTDLSNLTMFLRAQDNPRVGAAGDDQVINKLCGLIAGVIVMVLFTYVISVFVIHGIEKESSVIGALYALGVKRRDLICHYLMLPVGVTFLGGILGTALGFSDMGIPVQMQECYSYFSLPQLQAVYPVYLMIYSVVMPPVIAVIVNYLVIRSHLSRTVLSLLRKEQKESKGNNINLGKMKFLGRFQVRQMLRERRTGFTVVFGMFISLLILMLGIDCYVLLKHLQSETEEDTKFAYMYTYKYPDEQVPAGGEEAFAKSLKREMYGYQLEVTLLGIKADNPFFDANVKKGEDRVVISSAAAQKYRLKVGDDIVLKDEEAGRNYAFTITDVAPYASGLYVFMDLESMRKLFGEEDEYYNVVFSDHELTIPSGKLYGTTTRENIIYASHVFIEMLTPLITMLFSVSAIIFCVVMYLMLMVMIDRSAFGISLVKIFGYRTREIRKLYLNGNFYIVAVGAAICIPLAKNAIDWIYPYMISNVACGMNLEFSWQLYAAIWGGVVLLYLIINQMLTYRVKKVVLAEALKNRE